ncbi:MAG: FtsX-like permease family protein [Bacteroidales bacterium]|nr:FtsX-like permease family protein [Bacteroidales bacterium]
MLIFCISGNIYIPITCNEEFLSNSIWSGFSIALLEMGNSNDFEKLKNEFKNVLKKVDIADLQPCNHVEGSFTKDNYLGRIKLIFQSLLGFYEFENIIFYLTIAIIVLLFIILPSINLVNINVNRVYERLSEIGIRRSFGSSMKKLMMQFLFENLIITLFGGLLAVALALVVIFCINHFDLLAGIYLHFNITAFVISILSMFMLGLLSGLAPSIKMARKKIINSLNTVN